MATFPFILLLFAFLTLTIGLAWRGHYYLSKILFGLFLLAFMLVFWHHMSDTLAISL